MIPQRKNKIRYRHEPGDPAKTSRKDVSLPSKVSHSPHKTLPSHLGNKSETLQTASPEATSEDDKKVLPKHRRTQRSSNASPVMSTSTSAVTVPSTAIGLVTPPPEPGLESHAIVSAYLGQGRLDPFQMFPIDQVPAYVQQCLDHGE
jgi:hypothetical protein